MNELPEPSGTGDRPDATASARAEEAQARLAAIVDNNAVGIYSRSLDGTILTWNPGAERMLGYTAAEVIGRPSSLIRPPDREPFTARNNDALLRRESVTSESSRLAKDGRVIGVLTTHSPIRDRSGNVVAVSIVMQDISELKAARAAMQESEHRFRDTFEQAAVGITRVDLAGVLVEVNRTFCEMLGYTREELIGRPVRELTHPDDYGQGADYRARLADGAVGSSTAEKRFFRKDGTVLWARRTMSSARDAAGRPLYVISVVEDITAGKEAEERYRATFENAPVGIMHTAIEDDRILHVNPRLCEMTGYTAGELLGMVTHELLAPAFSGTDHRSFRERIVAGELKSYASERRLLRKDGSAIWISRTMSLARDPAGRPLYFIRILADISERKQAEDERARLAAIVESSNDAIYTRSREGTILSWNAAAERLYGWSARETVGQFVRMLAPPERVGAVRPISERALRGEQVEPIETTHLHKDGTRLEVQLTLSPVRDGQGAIVALSCAVRDVSARRRAEQALAASEAQLRSMFHDSPAAQSVVDAGSGRYVDVNRAWSELTGYAREEVLGRPVSEVALRDPEEVGRLLARVGHDGHLDGWEGTIRRRDGATRTCVASAQRLGSGERQRLLWWLIDVTEERAAKRRIEAARAHFEAMFHESPAPLVLVTESDARYLDVNQAWTDMTGYRRERVIGRTSLEFGLFDHAAERDDVYALFRQQGRIHSHELALRRANGEPMVCLTSGRLVEVDSGRAILWSYVDITAQRAARREIEALNASLEATVAARTAELSRANAELKGAFEDLRSSQDALLQSEKLAALGRLVAGIAHELNTPIGNSLLSATTLAEHTETFAAAAEAGDLRRSALQSYVGHAREAGEILHRNLGKAAHLIQSFKQVAADQASSQRRAFGLREVVDEVLLTHYPIFKKTPIEMATDVPEGIRLDSYPGPLGQVLGNLVTNAVTHGYEGRTRGTVFVSARLDGAEGVEIAVRDEGCGISEADLKRIFDPFFTTRMGRGGTGLGLSICHQLVTGPLGGTIRAASRLGQGAVFIVRIPLRAPVATEQSAA